MGNILGVPLPYALKRTFKNKSGITGGLKEVVAYSHVERHSSRTQKRFDLYKPFTSEKWEETGLVIPKIEEDLEHQRSISRDNQQTCDEIFFCGFNSSNEKLVVKISRNSEGLASVWVYLALSDGKSYKLPQQEKLWRVPKTGNNTFASAGLRLKCLLPMRKWRVAYTGLLEEDCGEIGDKKLVFVKIRFTWIASSSVFDLQSDIPSSLMAAYISNQKWDSYSPDLQSLQEHLDHYIQAGNFVGTVQVGGEEEQVKYLWGARKRSYESVTTQYVNIEYFGYTSEGEMIYFGQIGSTDDIKGWLNYGFIVQANSLGGPVDLCQINGDSEQKNNLDFIREKTSWNACFEQPNISLLQSDFQRKASLQFCDITLNSNQGKGLILSSLNGPHSNELQKPKVYLPVLESSSTESIPLVISLMDPICRFSEISGGKGSSLSELHYISRHSNLFSVPKGVAVTTWAYECFIKESKLAGLLEILQIVAGSYQPEDFRKKCESTSAAVGSFPLPAIIQDALKIELARLLGPKYQEMKVAVRSSASGEDSEELSAAGQMTTYLGVKGIDEISKAVVKCWASQFQYIAAQYKRQNGQALNSPMCVVVQEMVEADVAGVMFTCNPVTGNPAHITITANYGIGESVVSATAEPDTVVLERQSHGSPEVKSTQVGRKNIKTIIDTTGGVKEEQVSQEFASVCSLSAKFSIQLAQLGILVEEAYGCLLDIEWAIKDGNLYLLQARPVTTFDRETDFEIIHQFDTFLRGEKEWHTLANIGEVFPGVTSNLGLSSTNKFMFEGLMLRTWGRRSHTMFPWCPYFSRGMATYGNRTLFNILDVILRYYSGEHTLFTKSQMIGTFGRILTNEDMYKRATFRNKLYPPSFAPSLVFYLLKDLLLAGKHLKEREKKYRGFEIIVNHKSTAEEMYYHLIEHWFLFIKPFTVHFECSFLSSLSNVILFSILVSETGDFNLEVYSDVANVLSSCPKVVSADVPLDMELLAQYITNDYGQGFELLETREALMWLERSTTTAGVQFRKFLDTHGHRCVKEFDLYSNPWGSDPIPLVKILQDMSMKVDKQCTIKTQASTEETMKNLKVPLSWKNRQLMKFVIPKCQNAVSLREGSKSLMIGLINSLRKAYRQLGERMVLEGRLPDAQLIYFLEHFEFLELLRTRSPVLIQKALRRKNLFPEMDRIVLPELMEGIPIPIVFNIKPPTVEGSLLVQGVPVSQGIARGRARVATSLKEAADIQDGEILIAFSTDIGWSPYFPMLKGVVTELGGLISHGAVVAREYGLPCVVSAVGATQQFYTGDLVEINGNKGTVQRIDE